MAEEFDFDGPASIVKDQYMRSVALANSLKSEMSGFLDGLRQSIYAPPSVNVTWQTVAAPTIATIPNMPSLPSADLGAFGSEPGALSANLGEVTIDDFTATPPALPDRALPEINFGTVPVLPTVNDVAVPVAPTVTLPTVPTMLTLSTHTFGGIDLHEDWLDKLDDIPTLSVLAPTKLSYTRGAGYASALLDNLKATINARLTGASGLSPAVEQGIWDRARDRETQIALAREEEAKRAAEAMGFPLPTGALAGMLADSRREYHDKLSSLSRDVAIKQAELAQENLRHAIDTAISLETQLMDQAYKLELLVFEAAKAAADNEIQAHNAALEHFKALLAGYQAYASAYETLIKAELNKVEVFKVLLSAEELKSQINTALVQQYKAQIEGAMATVEIYKSQVSAAQTLVELEKAKIQTAGEQIRAFVALNNAEMSKVELFKAQLGADGMKVENYKALAQAYSAKAGAQAEKARVTVAQYQAQVAGKGLEWDGWKAKVNAQVARVDAAAKQASVLVDGYKVAATATQAQAELYARMWEASMKQYEASQNLTLQAAKINGDALMHTNDARLDASKVGAQIMAQQVSSAFNAVATSASITGGASMSIVQQV